VLSLIDDRSGALAFQTKADAGEGVLPCPCRPSRWPPLAPQSPCSCARPWQSSVVAALMPWVPWDYYSCAVETKEKSKAEEQFLPIDKYKGVLLLSFLSYISPVRFADVCVLTRSSTQALDSSSSCITRLKAPVKRFIPTCIFSYTKYDGASRAARAAAATFLFFLVFGNVISLFLSHHPLFFIHPCNNCNNHRIPKLRMKEKTPFNLYTYYSSK
jgi:hypothetical protein